MDQLKIKKAVKLLLEALGENPNRAGLKATPQRVAKFYQEFLAPSRKNPADTIKVYPNPTGQDLVLTKNIFFYSLCEHHLLPFFGKAHIAYIPANNKIAGFSSLARLVENLASGPQLQERLTAQIADLLMKKLASLGVLVIVEAEHLCLSMRGIKKPGTLTVTVAKRGVFKDKLQQKQVLALIRS
ncbi:MAG: GTP cyclohydrolase I FolE [candidate division Zixibacteria bacterium RBG_16_40_9]|nr:MAG: GTP cyclohydrolase I FolE [candidate division Zixibacteria bacterium RBG_16_40_9]